MRGKEEKQIRRKVEKEKKGGKGEGSEGGEKGIRSGVEGGTI